MNTLFRAGVLNICCAMDSFVSLVKHTAQLSQKYMHKIKHTVTESICVRMYFIFMGPRIVNQIE